VSYKNRNWLPFASIWVHSCQELITLHEHLGSFLFSFGRVHVALRFIFPHQFSLTFIQHIYENTKPKTIKHKLIQTRWITISHVNYKTKYMTKSKFCW
jgi:hypothetical protein